MDSERQVSVEELYENLPGNVKQAIEDFAKLPRENKPILYEQGYELKPTRTVPEAKVHLAVIVKKACLDSI